MNLYTDHDPYCCEVLGARVADGSLPAGDVLCADVRALTAETLAPHSAVHLFCGIGGSPLGLKWAGWPDDLSIVTGGFPCQDISSAGKGEGLDGARSGLFWEMMRVVRLKRPDCVFGENVGALSARGLDRVVGALGEVGYQVHAFRLGAWAVGSPQQRERWWILACRSEGRCGARERELHGGQSDQQGRGEAGGGAEGRAVADAGGGGAGKQPGRIGGPGGQGAAGFADDRAEDGELDDGRGRGRGPGTGEPGDEGRARIGGDQSAGSDQAGQLGLLHRSGLRAIGGGPAEPRRGADPTGPGVVAVGETAGAGLENGLGGEVAELKAAERGGDPGRWVHPLWTDADGNAIPTPQHEWEPPRLYPGSSMISARWRCGLMGYPLDWLDLEDEVLARLAPKSKTPAKRAKWGNKEGVKATGNAQVPQCVTVLATAWLAAMETLA